MEGTQVKTGLELIAEERQEQIKKHGRSIEEDVKYNANQELRYGAIFLLTNRGYPKSWDKKWKEKFLKKSYLEQLVIAGALLAAEIDRLQNKPLNHDDTIKG